MNRDDVVQYLRELSPKAFAELFYAATAGKHPWPYEQHLSEGRYILACADRDIPGEEHDTAVRLSRPVSMVCPVPDLSWGDDASLSQQGSHCGMQTM